MTYEQMNEFISLAYFNAQFCALWMLLHSVDVVSPLA